MTGSSVAFVDLETTGGYAGGVRHYIKLAEALRRDAGLIFITRRIFTEDFLRLSITAGFFTYESDFPIDPAAFFRGLNLGRKLRAKVRGVVSTNFFFNTLMFSLGLSISAGVPLIVMMHHQPRLHARVTNMGLYGLASYIFYLPAVLSRHIPRTYLFYTEGGKARGHNIYHVISSYGQIKPLKVGSSDRDIDVCYIGRLSMMKGFHEFLKVCEVLRYKHPTLNVHVTGSNFFGRLPEWVHHRENVSEEEKYNILSGSKVFLFPSHEEGFSLAIAEAMYNGAAVVSWDLPEYPFRYIIRIKEYDVTNMVHAVEELLSNEQKRQRIAHEAYNEITEKMTNEDRIQKEAALILDITSRRTP